MSKKLVWLVVLLVVVIGGYAYYRQREKQKAIADGDVSGLPAPDRSTTSTDSAAASTTPDSSSAPATVQAKQAAPTPAPVATAPAPAMTAPASDSLPENSSEGVKFGGKGIYQWYRQGNLTWRINTQTGKSCIIYATMEEWRKEIVMRNGCGHNA